MCTNWILSSKLLPFLIFFSWHDFFRNDHLIFLYKRVKGSNGMAMGLIVAEVAPTCEWFPSNVSTFISFHILQYFNKDNYFDTTSLCCHNKDWMNEIPVDFHPLLSTHYDLGSCICMRRLSCIGICYWWQLMENLHLEFIPWLRGTTKKQTLKRWKGVWKVEIELQMACTEAYWMSRWSIELFINLHMKLTLGGVKL